MRVVKNCCWGGFGLSEACYKELGIPWDGYGYLNCANEDTCKKYGIPKGENAQRSWPELIAVIDKLGAEICSGRHAKLVVVDIPFDTTEGWHIDDYDGMESIKENHKSW